MPHRRGLKTGFPGLSGSWRQALEVTLVQAILSKQIGITLSRSSQQRKVGRSLVCCWVLRAIPVAGVNRIHQFG